MSLMYQICRMMLVGWLIFRLNCWRYYVFPAHVRQTWIQPWCGLLCWAKLLKVGRLAAHKWFLLSALLFCESSFNFRKLTNKLWQNAITQVMQRPISSLSQDNLTPPTTRCLIQNFWRGPSEIHRQTSTGLHDPPELCGAAGGALQWMFGHQWPCIAELPGSKNRIMGARTNQICFPQNEV